MEDLNDIAVGDWVTVVGMDRVTFKDMLIGTVRQVKSVSGGIINIGTRLRYDMFGSPIRTPPLDEKSDGLVYYLRRSNQREIEQKLEREEQKRRNAEHEAAWAAMVATPEWKAGKVLSQIGNNTWYQMSEHGLDIKTILEQVKPHLEAVYGFKPNYD